MDRFISILLILLILLIFVIFLKNDQINVNVIIPNFENEYTTFYNSNKLLNRGTNKVGLNKGGYLHIYIKDSEGKVVNNYYYGNNSKANKNWTLNDLVKDSEVRIPELFVNIQSNLDTITV